MFRPLPRRFPAPYSGKRPCPDCPHRQSQLLSAPSCRPEASSGKAVLRRTSPDTRHHPAGRSAPAPRPVLWKAAENRLRFSKAQQPPWTPGGRPPDSRQYPDPPPSLCRRDCPAAHHRCQDAVWYGTHSAGPYRSAPLSAVPAPRLPLPPAPPSPDRLTWYPHPLSPPQPPSPHWSRSNDAEPPPVPWRRRRSPRVPGRTHP